MKDSQQNELKIGDRCTVEVEIIEVMADEDRPSAFVRLRVMDGFGDASIYGKTAAVTRIPDDPNPYEPPLSVMAAPVDGSKPEERP